MSEITYISEELVMDGNLDSAGSSVVVAGRFKGELRAKDVLLEANSIFDGTLIADKVTLGGLVKGEVSANTLNVASSAKVEGNLKTNALSIDFLRFELLNPEFETNSVILFFSDWRRQKSGLCRGSEEPWLFLP